MEQEVKYSRIESKEIRGLNLRTLIGLVLATISIVTCVLFTKYSIESQIAGINNQIIQVKNDQETFGKINDMNFKIYDSRFEKVQDQIDELTRKVDKLLK